MMQHFPEPDETPEAAEGTASHEIGSNLILNQTVGTLCVNAEKFVGQKASNGVIFTEEMYDAAKIYADDVGEVMRETGVFAGDHFGNEFRIEAKRINDQSFGTIDQFIYYQKTSDLYLWDYKYGFELVEVFENWQLINYASGILEHLKINGLWDQHVRIHFRIAQPRAFHRDGEIREWVVNAADLRPLINTLHVNAGISLSTNSTIQTGSHCRHCNARHGCPAAIQAGLRLYEVSMRPVPVELSNDAIGVQLAIIKRAKKQLEFLESGFEEQVKSKIRSGENIRGWLVEQGFGREKWAKPIAEVLSMGNMMGYDLKKPDEAITPNQARKLGIDAGITKEYSITPKTGMKIVSDNGDKARQIFGGIKDHVK